MNRSGGMTKGQGDSSYQKLEINQTASPTNGQTVNLTATSTDLVLWLTPAGTIAGATITWMADGASVLNQIVTVGTSATITTPVFNGATTFFNSPTTLNSGDTVQFKKVAANTWARLI